MTLELHASTCMTLELHASTCMTLELHASTCTAPNVLLVTRYATVVFNIVHDMVSLTRIASMDLYWREPE